MPLRGTGELGVTFTTPSTLSSVEFRKFREYDRYSLKPNTANYLCTLGIPLHYECHRLASRVFS